METIVTAKDFNSIEELFSSIEKQRELADHQITNAQNSIKPGDKVIRITPGLAIYGEILDPLKEEIPYYDFKESFDVAEWDRMKQKFTGLWKTSYRYGRFYSPRCSEGELGNIHLSTIHVLISEDDFKRAKKAGWPQSAPDFGKIARDPLEWIALLGEPEC